jgi:hypothetical protein
MARQRGRQDNTNLCGVLGLANTQSGGVFQGIPNAQTRETPYIQHRHFGAAFARMLDGDLGNRLKTVEKARRSSASIVKALNSRDGSPAAFFSRIDLQRFTHTSAPDSQTHKDGGKAREIRPSHAQISPLFPALSQRRQPDKPC